MSNTVTNETKNEITISIKEAAKRLAVTDVTVRKGIEQGMFPFGVMIKSQNGKRNQYFVYARRLEAWLEGQGIK